MNEHKCNNCGSNQVETTYMDGCAVTCRCGKCDELIPIKEEFPLSSVEAIEAMFSGESVYNDTVKTTDTMSFTENGFEWSDGSPVSFNKWDIKNAKFKIKEEPKEVKMITWYKITDYWFEENSFDTGRNNQWHKSKRAACESFFIGRRPTDVHKYKIMGWEAMKAPENPSDWEPMTDHFDPDNEKASK